MKFYIRHYLNFIIIPITYFEYFHLKVNLNLSLNFEILIPFLSEVNNVVFVCAGNFFCPVRSTYRSTLFILNTSVPSKISCSVFQNLIRLERTMTLLLLIFGKHFLSHNAGRAITGSCSDKCLGNVYTETNLYIDSLADNLVISISLEACTRALDVSLSNLETLPYILKLLCDN